MDARRSYQHQFGGVVVQITAGESYVTDDPEEMVGTMLGSCVSVCLRDTRLGVGGMNHFLLPDSDGASDDVELLEMRYGVFAMEHLLNEVLKMGGQRERLEAKVFGGGTILPNLRAIGQHNVEFVRRFLRDEKLRVESAHVGGSISRRIVFHPGSGKVFVRPMRSDLNRQVAEAEGHYVESLRDCGDGSGGVELF